MYIIVHITMYCKYLSYILSINNFIPVCGLYLKLLKYCRLMSQQVLILMRSNLSFKTKETLFPSVIFLDKFYIFPNH